MDAVPVAVLLGVMVLVIVTLGDFVISAVTEDVMVLEAVFVAVCEGVFEGVPV